jgi:hypothetical protein
VTEIDHDVVASLGERDCFGAPDAAARTGDERYPSTRLTFHTTIVVLFEGTGQS